MDFAAAEQYLLGTINEVASRRTSYKLERMVAFLDQLGNPHRRYPTVHIGGTSGKGSTSSMIAATLSQRKQRTGLHTKPHLRSMTERARIDGIAIVPERFAQCLTEMMPAVDRVTADYGRPTYYETLLALAFVYFAQESVDIAVIEVGLGGRLDGTNVITPLAAAITSIGFDHTEVLGETLEEIAHEKAGIAKPGVPLIVSVDEPAPLATIEACAHAARAPIVRTRDVARVEDVAMLRDAQRFSVVTSTERYTISTGLLGDFQRINAASAIAVLETLPQPFRPRSQDVEEALATLRIPGRMEVYPGHPTVVFDIAHNEEKAAHLVASLRESFPARHLRYVVAIGEGKDAREIIARLAQVPAQFIFTGFEANGRQAIDAAKLARIAEGVGTWGRALADPVEALAIARRDAVGDDVVVVTGSTFVVAQLREWWMSSVAV